MSRRAAASYKPQTPACHAIRLQTCTFVFNNFQDAPPATPFPSSFCIVAGGWVGPSSNIQLSAANLRSLYLLCLQSLAHSLAQWSTRNIFGINRLRTLSRAMGGGGYVHSELCEGAMR